MRFEFATATRIVFGPGASRETGMLVKTLGKRPLLITGRHAARWPAVQESLRIEGLEVVPFSVSGEPDLATIEEGVTLARERSCDSVVALGGGSVIDAGKAIAAMLSNSGRLLDFLEVIGEGKSLGNASLPVIAVPTTAGTGAEVTRNAVLSSPEHKVKVSLRSHFMFPKVALIDPELTMDLPADLTASTGLDALTQVIEPYVCSRPNPITDALCEDGMRRAARSLRTAFKQPHNAMAREDMAAASLFGGLALTNAGLGAVHGFAGPIGGMFPAPHGGICAALLPHVTAMNLRALRARMPGREALTRYYTVARCLTERPTASPDDGVEWLRWLVAELGIPRLRTYGITQSHFAELTEKAARASSMKANPIALTREELTEILEQAL